MRCHDDRYYSLLPPVFAVCMYKEPSLHELEEKLLKSSRSPTMNSPVRARSLERQRRQEEGDVSTDREGS